MGRPPKLTEEQVIAILNSPHIHGKELAYSLGMSPSAISDIRNGRTWPQLQGEYLK